MDYKKYSLEQLENWLHDAISTGEASAQEIYDTIKKVVDEEYYIYKDRVSKCYDLLALLNGNGSHLNFTNLSNDTISFGEQNQNSLNKSWEEYYYPEEAKDDGMRLWGHSDLEYGIANSKTYDEIVADGNEMTSDGFWVPSEKSKPNKWVLPVEVDGASGEYYVSFPDDMLNQLSWEEGDTLEYIDNKDGSFTIKRVEKKVGTI